MKRTAFAAIFAAACSLLAVPQASAIRPPIPECESGNAEERERPTPDSPDSTDVCLCKSWHPLTRTTKGTICEEKDVVTESLSYKYTKIPETTTRLPAPYDVIPCFVFTEEKHRTTTSEMILPVTPCSGYDSEPEDKCFADVVEKEFYYILTGIEYDEVAPFTSRTSCLKSVITRNQLYDQQFCPAPYASRVSGYAVRTQSDVVNHDDCLPPN